MAIRKPQKPRRKRKSPNASEFVSRDPTLWADLLAIARSIPEEELAKLPRDGSINDDHYIYGTPKRYTTPKKS